MKNNDFFDKNDIKMHKKMKKCDSSPFLTQKKFTTDLFNKNEYGVKNIQKKSIKSL